MQSPSLKYLSTLSVNLDLLDLAEGSEVVNQVIQNAEHKITAKEIIADIIQIKNFIKTVQDNLD
jgi:hypothetical protein